MVKRSRKAPSEATTPTLPALWRSPHRQLETPKPTKPVKPPAAKKNPHAVALGRKGGKVGGKARAAALTAKERHSIAVKAARARWGMKDEE